MAEERDEKKINPGGPEEPSREDEIGTDQGTSSGSEQTEDTKRGETEKKKKQDAPEQTGKTGEKMQQSPSQKMSLFERFGLLLSRIRRFFHHILHPQPDSQIIPKRRRPFERRQKTAEEQADPKKEDPSKEQEEQKDQDQDKKGKGQETQKDADKKGTSKEETEKQGTEKQEDTRKQSGQKKEQESGARESDEVSRMEKRTKEAKQKRSLRDYGNLFFHIIARRGLGREGYMHALQMGEQAEREAKEEAARASQGDSQRSQPDGNGGSKTPMPDVNKPDQSKTERQEGEKGQPDKPEPQPERPLKHLYEVFTKDTAESNKFLANYEKRLAEHLEQIEHQPVDAKATRNGDGTITFDIACGKDEMGTKASFLKATDIHVTMDSNYNIIEAVGRDENNQEMDVTETLGAYIAADLAGNFREDYNRADDVHNVLSGKTFADAVTRTVKDPEPLHIIQWNAVNPGRGKDYGDVRIDNVLYHVQSMGYTSTDNKSNSMNDIVFTPVNGQGKAFKIPSDHAQQAAGFTSRTFAEAKKTEATIDGYLKSCDQIDASTKELQEKQKELSASRAKENALMKYNPESPELTEITKQNKILNYQCKELKQQISGALKDLVDDLNAKQQADHPLQNDPPSMDDTDALRKYLETQKQPVTECIQSIEKTCGTMTMEEAEAKATEAKDAIRKQIETARAVHIENVNRERQDIRHIFDTVLPTAKNDPFAWSLEELNAAALDPDRSLQEILEPEPEAEQGQEQGQEQRQTKGQEQEGEEHEERE